MEKKTLLSFFISARKKHVYHMASKNKVLPLRNAVKRDKWNYKTSNKTLQKQKQNFLSFRISAFHHPSTTTTKRNYTLNNRCQDKKQQINN